MAINEPKTRTDSKIHGATATQYRFTLHVPCQFNNGDAVAPAFVASLEHELLTLFGGFTRVASDGGWMDPAGTVYLDKLTLYHIDCPTDQCGHKLRQVAEGVKRDLLQDCVYVTRQQITTWLV